MIKPKADWASSYKSTWDKVFRDAQKEGFDPKEATAKAWAKWNNDNAKKIECIPPLPPGLPVSGKNTESKFFPVNFKGSSTADKAAKILADAWLSWVTAITWKKVPPAPPYSKVQIVQIDPATSKKAHAKLIKDLTTEFKKVPKDDKAVEAKYKAIGTIFYNAVKSLKVQFIGLDTKSPPSPLKMSVPVF